MLQKPRRSSKACVIGKPLFSVQHFPENLRRAISSTFSANPAHRCSVAKLHQPLQASSDESLAFDSSVVKACLLPEVSLQWVSAKSVLGPSHWLCCA